MLCQKCFRDLPEESSACPNCGAAAALPQPGGEGTVAPAPLPGPAASRPGGEGSSPWDERGRIGLFAAVGGTLQESLFRPTEFFRRLGTADRVGGALVYAAVIGSLSAMIALMWQRLLVVSAMEALMPEAWEGVGLQFEGARGLWYVALALLPFGIVALTVIWAAVLHVFLIFLGGAPSGFGATVKAVAYSTSADAFSVIPFCGPPIGAVWRSVLIVIGLRETHRVSGLRAFLALVLPFVLLICVTILLGAGLIFAILKFFPVLAELIEV